MNLVKIKFSTTANPPVGDVEIIEIDSDDDDDNNSNNNNNNNVDAEIIIIDSDDDDNNNNNTNNINNNNVDAEIIIIDSDDDDDDDGDVDDTGDNNGDNNNDGNNQIMADGETTPILRDVEPSSMDEEQLERVLQATEVALARECLEVDRSFRSFFEALVE